MSSTLVGYLMILAALAGLAHGLFRRRK